MLRIANNLPALTAFHALNATNQSLNKIINELSTGLRINSASDDAAGFAISEKMRSQISGLDRALQNSQDGISLLQTAEGALEQTNSMLQRMRELSLQASNGSLTSQDRQYIQLEIDQLKDQIDRIAETTQFNKKRILDGSSGALWASSDLNVNLKINSGLTYIDRFGQKVSSEGNYRIEIKADPGQAQVQKSALMLARKIDDTNTITETVRSIEAKTITETEHVLITEEDITTEEPYVIYINGIDDEHTDVVDNLVRLPDNVTVENPEAIEAVRNGWTFANGVLTITSNGTYNIVGRESSIPATNRIKVAEGLDDVNIFLTNVNIDVRNISLACPFEISSGSTVNVYLSGENTLKSGNARAGLEVPDGATLTLSSASGFGSEEGKLTAIGLASGMSGAGIGGPGAGYASSGRAGNITVNGGTIIAAGGTYAAGIGGGDTRGNDGGGHIVINGGNITASGGFWGAGIGQGDCTETYTLGDDSITINGGTVTARGGDSSAGIGGGHLISGGTIRIWKDLINNGSITANPGASCQNAIGDGTGAPSSGTVEYYEGDADLPDPRPGVASLINIVEHSTILVEKEVQTTKQVTAFIESARIVTDDRNENTLDNVTLNSPAESVKATGLPEGSYTVSSAHTQLTSPDFQLTGFYGIDPSSLITLNSGTGNLLNNANIIFEVTDVNTSAGTVTLKATANIMGTDGEITKHVVREGLVLHEGAAAALSGISLSRLDADYDMEEAYPAVTMSLSDGAASQFSAGNKFVYNITVPTSGNFGRTLKVSRTSSDSRSSQTTRYGLEANQVSGKELTFSNFYIDSLNGTVYEGDIVLNIGNEIIENASTLAAFETQDASTITSEKPTYEAADASTKLSEVIGFYDSQGVFMLNQPQTIKITQGDDRSTSITLYSNDTLEEVREKLNDAIGNGLGNLSYADTNNFVTYVNKGSATPQTDESVAGTFVIRSGIPGKGGELSFSGGEDFLKALGLNTIQESSETRYTASIYDAHSGKVISSGAKVTDNVINNALTGVDIEFNAMAGIKSSWDENSKRYVLTSGETYSAVIHLKDNGITFQTGANKGEDFSIQLGDMSSKALGVSSVNVASMKTASRSVGVIDRAINRVSSQRAKIGAYQNALEHTMENLTTTSANLTAAESRIRDADMSKIMMEFVKLQILNQSGTSMLAQANQLPQSVLKLIGG